MIGGSHRRAPDREDRHSRRAPASAPYPPDPVEVIDLPPLFALLDRSYQAAPFMTDLRFAPLNAATVITLSAWVGVSGAVFDQANLDVCAQDNYALELLCWYTPEFSVLWRPFVAPTSLSVGPMLFAAYCGLVYMWLSVPLLRTLIVRGSRSIAAGRVSLKTWRF